MAVLRRIALAGDVEPGGVAGRSQRSWSKVQLSMMKRIHSRPSAREMEVGGLASLVLRVEDATHGSVEPGTTVAGDSYLK